MTKVWRKSVNRYWRYRLTSPSRKSDVSRESRTDARTDGRTTRKHIASAGAYRRRRLKNHYKRRCIQHFAKGAQIYPSSSMPIAKAKGNMEGKVCEREMGRESLPISLSHTFPSLFPCAFAPSYSHPFFPPFLPPRNLGTPHKSVS